MEEQNTVFTIWNKPDNLGGAVYHEAGIGCISGIASLVLLLDSAKVDKIKLDL